MTVASSFTRFLFAEDNLRGRRRDRCFLFIDCLLFLVLSIVLVEAAPRSKSKNREVPQLVYDQKQTGDYNIQVHLKDFQIIALLGDDSLGDYDYNYDYADFTIKPSTSTTQKPTSTSRSPPPTTEKQSSTTTTELPAIPPSTTSNIPAEISVAEHSNTNTDTNPSSTLASNQHPYSIEVVVLQPTKQPLEKIKVKSSKKPIEELEDNSNQDVALLNEILKISTSSSSSTDNPSSTTPLPPTSSPTPEPVTPGKIKVQILEGPSPTEAVAAVPVGIVPGEDVQAEVDGAVLHGELASYRKCASGFSRDKRGRCRRVRRPGVASQLPFGFSRIASNLATRLRLPNQAKPTDAPISA